MEAFNNRQKKTRSLIERCNGLLKMRFRCLLKHRVLHYQPDVCSKIINACTVLHNMCIQDNVPLPELDADENDPDLDLGLYNDELNEPVLNRVNQNDLAAGRKFRNHLIRRYFS